MTTEILVKHQHVKLQSTYDDFTTRLEALVNQLHPEYASGFLSHPQDVRAFLECLQGETGLIIFNIQRHGDLLNLAGKSRKAKQYVIGNPLVAIQMTAHDIRAALYAPLRIIVYELDDHTAAVEYDLPSSLFGQFGNPDVLVVGASLDVKLLNAILQADGVQP